MDRINIGSENEQVEYKKSTGELKEGIVSICSILNKHGSGDLYFGIKNNGDVIGQKIGESTLRDVSRAIRENIKPAIREADINAFAHRIIESRQSVDISIYKSFIEIYSPGKFPEGIQPEQFITEIRKPIRRNPLITRTLYYSKDMESFATGLKRIHDACNDAGVTVEFRGDAYGFTVRFYHHCGGGWAEVVHSKGKNAQANAQVKSMEDRIMEFCKTAHTMKDIQMMLGVKDIRTARKYVRILIENHQNHTGRPCWPLQQTGIPYRTQDRQARNHHRGLQRAWGSSLEPSREDAEERTTDDQRGEAEDAE